MSYDAFENSWKYAVGVELSADGMELVFKPFEVFLG